MAHLTKSLINYLIVVGAEDVPVPANVAPEENYVYDYSQPITDIVIVEDVSQCPVGYENEAVIIGDKCKELCLEKAHDVESYKEFFVCVSRAQGKAPITDMIYMTDTENELCNEYKDFQPVEQPQMNLTPSIAAPFFFKMFVKRETNKLPIAEIAIVTNDNSRFKDKLQLERTPTTDSLGSVSVAGSKEKFDVHYIKVPHGVMKVPILIYMKPIQEYPAVGSEHLYRSIVLDRYPLEDDPRNPLPYAIANFCLPDDIVFQTQYSEPFFFCFALTDSLGVVSYGSCYTFYEEIVYKLQGYERRLYSPKCICILSHWSYFCNFKTCLMSLHSMISEDVTFPMESYIVALLEVPVPPQGSTEIELQLGETIIPFSRPPATDFPLANFSMLPLFRSLSLDNIATILCLILTECKILFQTNCYGLSTPVMESLLSLLFPFRWQHIYIPFCPPGCLDFLQAPVPFLIGVRTGTVTSEALGSLPTDVYLVDLDKNRIQKKRDINSTKVPPLPAQSQFLERLRSIAEHLFVPGYTSLPGVENEPFQTLSSTNDENQIVIEMIREAFLDFFVSILRSYGKYLVVPTADTIKQYSAWQEENPSAVFDRVGFLSEIPEQDQKFMKILLDSQAFSIFLEQRSFVSDRDDELQFFDKCIDKADEIENKIQNLKNNPQSLNIPRASSASTSDLMEYLKSGSSLSISGVGSSDSVSGKSPRLIKRNLSQTIGSSNSQNANSNVNQIKSISPSNIVRTNAENMRVVRMKGVQKANYKENEGMGDDEVSLFNYNSKFPRFKKELFPELRPSFIHLSFNKDRLKLMRRPSEFPTNAETTENQIKEIPHLLRAQHFCLTIYHTWLYVWMLFMPGNIDIDLAFQYANDAFKEMRRRNIGPDEKCYRFLLSYCSRHGIGQLASNVFQIMNDDDKIHPSAVTTGLFVKAVLKEQQLSAKSQKKKQSIDEKINILDEDKKSVTSFSLLGALIGDLNFNINQVVMQSHNVCSSCNCLLSEEEIMASWSLSLDSPKVSCPQCNNRFAPILTYESTEEGFENGNCVYLPPTILYHEVDIAFLHYGTQTNQINKAQFSESFAKEHPILFWNMVWFFSSLSLPLEMVQRKLRDIRRPLIESRNNSNIYGLEPYKMTVNLRVNGLKNVYNSRPLCKIKTKGFVLHPAEVVENKRGTQCLSTIEKIIACVNSKQIKRAMELFLDARVRYSPVVKSDLSEWFHLPMYVCLLSINIDGYETENDFAEDFYKAMYWLKPNNLNEVRSRAQSLPDSEDPLEAPDSAPRKRIIEFRSIFSYLQPKWEIRNTAWYKSHSSSSYLAV